MNKSPKSLIWYANKAGIPLERAESLWRKAVREATACTGWVGTSEYWGLAQDRFQELLAQEGARQFNPRVIPLLRSQTHILRLPLIALEDVVTAVSSNIRQRLQQRHAA